MKPYNYIEIKLPDSDEARPRTSFGTEVYAVDGKNKVRIDGIFDLSVNFPVDDCVNVQLRSMCVKTPKFIRALVTEFIDERDPDFELKEVLGINKRDGISV